MSRLQKFLSLALVIGLFFSLSAFAQSSGGALSGQVSDNSGAAVPGVTVTATNTQTGFSRSTVTDSGGAYRFAALPIGSYRLTAELSGFGSTSIERVEVNVATERSLDIALSPAGVSESITVTAEAPLIATSPSVGTVVSQQELESLPLNGRQFANLASLAPGTQLSVNSDPTKPGQLTIALNGGSGRNVNFIIDGGDNTDDTIGGALQNFNLEAVQEFKIQTMQYKAEYGRSTGGVLSVVTKSGTNDLAGSVYAFFRDKSLNSETESERQAGIGKQPYERQQFGASLGGPIVRDYAHFFATYEQTKRDTTYVLDSGGIFPDLDGQAIPLPFKDELGTAKATINLSAKQLLQVRYGYQKNSDKYGATPNYMPSSLGTVSNDYKSVLAGHTAQLGADRVNEFVYQWTRFDNAITADSNDPYLYFPSGVAIGQSINTPQATHQEKSQFKDDFSWSSNLFGMPHYLKAGFNYVHEPILGGDFTTGTSGQFNMLEDDPNSPVVSIDIFGGFFGNTTPIDQYSVYLQDDLSISPRLTLYTGVRYDRWDGFDLDQRSNPIWQAMSTSDLDIGWLEDFRGGKGGQLENDDNNWSPRLGFAFDLAGNGKNVVRGGVGRYYDFPYTNATILFPSAAVQSNYGTVYHAEDENGLRNADGSFYRPGIDPLPPNQLGNPQVPLPREVASPTLETPYSDQASLGYSFEVTDWLGLNLEAVKIQYRSIPYRFRANPIIDTDGDGEPDRRAFPQFSPRMRLWYGDGEADYDGVNVGFRARMTDRFEAQGFYTWSKTDGNVLVGADEFRMWSGALQPGVTNDSSVDPLNPQCDACFGPLYTDARHRVTLSALYRAPFGILVSGIARYRSATPYTDHAGEDLNGDGYDMDLAPGVSHVNSRRGEDFSQVDVRVSKEFGIGAGIGLEVIGEIFNLFNSDNPTAINGNRSSDNFGQPAAFSGDPGQGEQQLAQVGLRLKF